MLANRSQLVTVALSANKTQYNFANQPNLSGKKIKSIVAIDGSQTAKSSDGEDVSSVVASKGFITLKNTGNTVLHEDVPCSLLAASKFMSGEIISIDSSEIDWEKSHLTVQDAVDNTVALFWVIFE